MTMCGRCCLYHTMKMVNYILSILGIAIIVYSLWLQKMWSDGVAQLPSHTPLPEPWFIYTSLGVGIVVCLSTLFSCMVSNYINSFILCIYIFCICFLLLQEAAVIFSIFFKYQWSSLISKYIDGKHEGFKNFAIFHERMCRLIILMILTPQVSVVAMAIILWTVGIENITQNQHSEIPDFTRSFLEGTESGIQQNNTTLICRRCEVLRTENPRQSLFSYINRVFRMQYQRRSTPILC